MKGKSKLSTSYVALLRGINVTGRHKVPMSQLRTELESLGYSNVHTLLNSGNVIFRVGGTDEATLQRRIGDHLKDVFGFEIPTWVMDARIFQEQFREDPFREEELNEHTRCYVTFLDHGARKETDLPYVHVGGGFRIIGKIGGAICSVLDISRIGTADVMGMLEKMYGKGITTRNWNTVRRILVQLEKLET